MQQLPPLTDPTAITVIATSAVLTAAFIYISIKYVIDLHRFRNNIKPGDYAQIDFKPDYPDLIRAKFVKYDAPFYIFREINTGGLFLCIKSKIYKP